MKSSTTTDSPAIGIDLGTLYSCVGVWIDSENQVEIIPNDQGNRTTPSYVAFTDQETLIGNAAFNQIASNPVNTIYGVKRFIGKKYSNYAVQNDLKLWPFKVDKGPNNKPMVAVTVKGEIKRFSAEEISSMVLKKLKEAAELFLNRPIKDAVITVPAFFNSSQREATEEAGKMAGLNVLRVINEPTAAAIAYGLTSEGKGERNVLIFDLGGGTFDVSVLNIDGGLFEVKSTAGDNHLGGEDFTNKLVEFCAADFEQKSGHDIINNSRALRRLRAQCEKAKRILSSASHTTIEVDSLTEAVDYVCVITQAKFEEICHPLFQKTVSLVQKVLQDSNISKDNISDIVLVGGATRMPKISQILTQFFNGKEPNKNLNPEEVVACGAAIKAAIIAGQMNKSAKDISVIDLTESSKGLENADEEETDKKEGENEEKIEELGIQRRNVVKAELENYCHTVHNVLEDEILKKKFTESEKEELEKTCDGILMWIEVHKEAEEEDYVEKLKEIRGKYNLILSRGDEDERKKETANREYNEGPVTTYISAYQEVQGQTSVP